MKESISITAAIISVGLLMAFVQHRESRQLLENNFALQPRIEETVWIESENSKLQKLSINTNELERLRGERNELMRLRSEVGSLRQTAGLTSGELEKQLNSMDAELRVAQWRIATSQFKEASAERQIIVQPLAQWLLKTARTNGGIFPNSFSEWSSILERLPEGHPMRRVGMLNVTTQTGISANDFEFVPHARPLTTNDPPALLLRERASRTVPAGGWARWYGFSNGKVEEAISPDGQFEQWERQRQVEGVNR